MRYLVQLVAAAVSRRPGWTVVTIVGLTIVLGFFASRQEISNDNKDFLPDNDTAQALDEIQNEFETATAIPTQIVVEADNVFDPAVVAAVLELEQTIRNDDVVAPLLVDDENAQTFSYADALMLAAGGDMDALSSTPTDELVDRLPDAARSQVEALTAEKAEDGSAGAALVLANLDFSNDEDDVEAAEVHLADVVESADYENIDVRVFNQGVLQEVLDEGQQETGPLFGLAMLLILVVLVVLYRSASDVILGLVGLIMTVTWMYGLGVLMGPDYLGVTGDFNSMTIIIPVLLVGLAIDYAIHVISRYREEIVFDWPDQPRGAIAPAIRAVGAALILATITTGVGFLTNVLSPLPPIKDFGIFTALGVLAAFVVMTTFVPASRVLLDRRRVGEGKQLETKRVADTVPGANAVLGKIADVAERHPVPTLGIFGAITVVALVGATNLSTTFDQKDFIPQDNAVYDTLVFLEDEFASRGDTATLLVRGDLDDPQMLAAMAEASAALENVEGIAGPVQSSVLALARDWATQNPRIEGDLYDPAIAAALDDRDRPGGPAALYDALGTADPDGLAATVDAERTRGVIVLPLANVADPEQTEALVEDIDAAVTPLTDAGAEVVPTSEGIVVFEVMETLQSSQVQSIATTVVAAALILTLYFGFAYRRPTLGLLAVLPVALTIAWILGSMVLLGISFNVLTAMITALTIGIGVPYAIHVVNRFLEDFERHPNVREALHSTMSHTGGALLGSALTTILGFGVLVLSSMAPMRQFGGLTALTIFYALVASVVVLPALLVLWGRFRRGRDARADIDFDTGAGPDAAPDAAVVARATDREPSPTHT